MINRRVGIRIPAKLGIPKQEFDQAWAVLSQALDHIYAEDTEKLSFGEMYRIIYTQVLNRNGQKLYQAFEDYISLKLEKLREEELEPKVTGDRSHLLTKLCEVWKQQSAIFKTISDLTIYMDKVYSKPNRVLEIHEMGLQLFKKHILMKLQDPIINGLVRDINESRKQEEVDETKTYMWKTLVSMMETIVDTKDTFYLNYFEPKFLHETEMFYSSSFDPSSSTALECLSRIRELQKFENELAEEYLNSDTIVKINNILEQVLYNNKLNQHIPELIGISFKENNINLLQQIYSVSLSDDYRYNIVRSIKEYILNYCNDTEPKEQPKKRIQFASQWTSRVLEIYKTYHKFLSDINFGSIVVPNEKVAAETETKAYNSSVIVNETLTSYLNQSGRRSSEFITIYLDACLKLSAEKQNFKQVKSDLEAAVKIFKLLQEKDIFSVYYQQQLSKRLLQQKSSLDLERWLITQIKNEMGSLFTSKLEGMLRDVSASTELYKTFQKSNKENISEFMFKPQILTPTSWPFQNPDKIDPNFKLPAALQEVQDQFQSFYGKKYNQRVLKWSHHLSSIEVGHQFAKSYHEIHLPIYAASIFFLFKDHDNLSRNMIQDMTGLPDKELDRILLSMTTAPRSRILLKNPSSKTISETDVFSINDEFTAPVLKVKLQMITGVVTAGKPERTKFMDTVDRERMEVINAAIVRVMKRERRLAIGELQEAIAVEVATRFTLTIAAFKNSIETLIEKDYIQRDVDDQDTLHYIT
ncbi:Uncharacterized protein RNJ44_00734 [Nakaseomyces bracarensis]|uniref:Cullin family profile domain-containing protein n=1 Tax=Nakaseomyces bracarensis TaxID=273131 RepID=A0ABR4NRZ4_9SACH